MSQNQMDDVLGQPVEVRKVSVPQTKQVQALLRKNLRVHTRINACPCLTCCGPGKAIPFTLFNACGLHFCCPIVFVIIVTFVPWLIVKMTMSDPDTFLTPVKELGTVPKQWLGIPVEPAAGADYDLGRDAYAYSFSAGFRSPSDHSQGGSMVLPVEYHLFKEAYRTSYSWQEDAEVGYPVSCHCQTLALVGPDAAVDAFKQYIEAEYQAYNTSMLPNMRDFVEERRSIHRQLASVISSLNNLNVRRLARAAVNVAKRALGGGLARRLSAPDPEVLSSCDVAPGHAGPIFRKFASAADVDRWIDSAEYGAYERERSETSSIDRLCGAVIFENDVLSAAEPAFTLRFNVTDPDGDLDVSGDLTDVEVKRGSYDFKPLKWYYTSGFLSLQHLVQKFLGQQRGGSDMLDQDPHFFPAPTPDSEFWAFGMLAGTLLGNPFVMGLMFGPVVSSIAFYISRERQTRQRELMRMMGLSDSALMWSWVAMFMVLNFFITFIMTIFFVSFLLRKTEFFFYWMALWWYSNAVTTFGMMIAAMVTSDKMAAMAAFGALFATSCVSIGISDYDPLWKKALYSLLPPEAFILTTSTVWGWESISVGVSPDNVNTNLKNFNVGLGIFMLFADFWLYLALFYYLDNVATWHDVGVARKPWFCFTPAYWREVMGRPPVIEGIKEPGAAQEGAASSEFMESEDDEHLRHLRANNQSVLIRGLYKSFTDAAGQKVNAVNNLSITMYQDECFCLLGHNGAGKTTTMMMLTGCLPQSAGTIEVRGCQVPEHLRQIRSDMGFCPQHNVLVDELTVFEHLVLFGMIGGMSQEDVVKRGSELLTAVALMDKMQARSTALSGGMKRKLSCALAFLTNPYLVILDEPSSGMDPFARRGMWDTLKQWRTGHILCLTTHYMDEADALGDRIAIMSSGQLACSGSSAFLKRKFGCGYVISFAKKDTRASQDAEILQAVREAVGNEAEIMSTVGKELLIQVPFGVADKFPQLFTGIDRQKEALGIEAYGTSVTNLEEVFLKVAQKQREHKKQLSKDFKDAVEQPVDDIVQEPEGPVRKKRSLSKQIRQFFIQLYALIIRRFRHGLRNRLSCCIQLGVPVGCVFAFFLIIMLTTVHALPKLLLDTAEWNVDIRSGPRVPITLAGVQNDTNVNSILDAWAGVSGIDGLMTDRITPTELPDSVLNSTQQQGLARGYFQESAFMQRVLANKDLHEATQYGGIFYPENSSWCLSNFSEVCIGPGVTFTCNMSAIHAGPVLFSKHAAAALSQHGVSDVLVSNHPFQKTTQQKNSEEFVSGMFGAIIVMAAYGFVPSGATSYVVMEKEKDVKHQLIISGCSHVAYWMSNYLFDILWGILPVAGAWITFQIYGIDAFSTYPGLQASIALFLAFLPAMAGFAYMFAFLFNKAGVAFFVSLIFNLTFGILATVLVSILGIIPSAFEVARVLEAIFRFVPVFDLGYGHLMISLFWRQAEEYDYGPLSGLIVGGAWCPPPEQRGNPYREEVECKRMVGDEFFMLLITSVLWIVVVMLLDIVMGLPAVQRILSRISGVPSAEWCQHQAVSSVEDDLVTAEKERVNQLDSKKQFVYVNNIHKMYGAHGSHAVRGISFAAEEGQVFGLLGVNGAGKTTTFKMLCGQVEPTAGQVCIEGYDVSKQAGEARKFIGYCPQFDALLESLTSREHLYLYGRMKGLHSSKLATAVRNQLEALDLMSFVNSRSGQLSGGNKRKLSVAMATIGEPPMVFLDEPSAGMDPVARRGMWSVIQTIADKRKKSVVILTTHSMEEAEALCSRIAIQVDGQFRCLGTPQQIKSKYGMGLELNVRLKTPMRQEIEECCAKLGGTPQSVVEAGFARQQIIEQFGAGVVQELEIRPGAPLTGAPTTGMAALAEWSILVQCSQAFEQFVATELSRGSGSVEGMLTVLEKTQNVMRYQITPAALQGKFSSLGVLFQLFQENKEQLRMEDFQICQTSLEQIFNRFATMQASQLQAQRPAASAIKQVAQEPQPPQLIVDIESCVASGNPAASVLGKAAAETPETALAA